MTPINFGIGLDYNVLFSNVKYGNENMAGSIGSVSYTHLDVYKRQERSRSVLILQK